MTPGPMPAGVVPRRLRRIDLRPLLAWCGLVVMAVGVAVALPAAVERAADAALRERLSAAGDRVRTITVTQLVPARSRTRGEPRSDADLQRTGDRLHGLLPPDARSIAGAPVRAAQTPPYSLLDRTTGLRPDPQSRQKLVLRAQAGALDDVAWVSGGPPRGHVMTGSSDAGIPRFDIAVSTGIAAALGIGTGDQLLLQPDRYSQQLAAQVTGVFAADTTGPAATTWAGEPRLLDADVLQTLDSRTVTGVALVADESVQLLDRYAIADLDASWRMPVATDLIRSGTADAIAADLGAAEATIARLDDDNGRFALSSDLPDAVDRFQQELAGVRALVTIAVAGVAAVAVGAVAAMSSLLAARRADTWALLTARGLPRWRVALLLPRSLLPILLPAVGVVTVVGVAVAPPGARLAPAVTGIAGAVIALVAAATTAATTTAATTAAGTTAAGTTVTGTPRRVLWETTRGGRRLTVELTVALLAAAAVAALLASGAPPGPVLALAPTLVAAVLALVGARALPAIVGLVRRRARGDRGPIGLLAAVVDRPADPRRVAGMTVVAVALATAIAASAVAVALLAGSGTAGSAGDRAGAGAGDLLPVVVTAEVIAAATSLLLALVTLAVSRVAARRERARVLSVLRILGTPPADAARAARRSAGVTMLVTIGAGVAGGLLAAWVVTAAIDLDTVAGTTGQALRHASEPETP